MGKARGLIIGAVSAMLILSVLGLSNASAQSASEDSAEVTEAPTAPSAGMGGAPADADASFAGSSGEADAELQEEEKDEDGAADEGEPPPQDLREALQGLDNAGSPAPPPRYDEEQDLPPESGSPGEKRPLPDYEGRPEDGAHAGDYLVWVPRALFLPVHLVMEYVLRRPIVWGVTQIEKNHLPQKVEQALTWDDGNASLYPLIYADFGIRPNAGLVFRWEDFVPRHDIYVGGFVGPGDLWAAAASFEQHLFRDNSATLNWQGSYVRRPDNVYFGVQDERNRCEDEFQGCRYRTAMGQAKAELMAFEDYLSGVNVDFFVRHARFSTDADDPSVTEAEAQGLEGFDDGYMLLRPHLHMVLDTRAQDVDFTRGSGFRAEVFGSYNVDADNTARMWMRGGAELAGFYDFGTGQIVGLRLYGETIGNMGDQGASGERQDVPFQELIELGGSERMRSFLRGRLRGNHAWTATFEYRYPILWALDAGFYSSIGNVYESFSTMRFEKNYLNYGFLLRTSGDRGSGFEAIIGWGSNRFDSDNFSAVDQFRLTFGINQGF